MNALTRLSANVRNMMVTWIATKTMSALTSAMAAMTKCSPKIIDLS